MSNEIEKFGLPARHHAESPKSLTSRKEPERLSQQQELFVLEYMIDLNQTQAAIRAGVHPVYAQKTAAKWMKPGHLVNAAVARATAARSVRVGISGDRVLQELGRMAFGDTRTIFRDDGSLKAPTEYDADDAAMIEGIKTRRIVEIAVGDDGKQKLVPVEIQEVKLVSKTTALGMLMRHLGMNNDKLDVTVTPLAEALNAAYARMGKSLKTGQIDTEEGPIEVEYEEIDDDLPEGYDEVAEMLK